MDIRGATFAISILRLSVLNPTSSCVNALSWARGGDLLISGGDDTTCGLFFSG